MRIEQEPKLGFDDVLIRPKRSDLSSRKDVDLKRDFTFLHSRAEWHGIPIMAANMDTTGTFEMHNALYEHLMFTCLHKHYSIEEWKENFSNFYSGYGAFSIGIRDEDYELLIKLASYFSSTYDFRYICIDVANGYSERFIDFVKRIRDRFPQQTIIAGNVVTGDMTEALLFAGADIVKVGIGPGSMCTTRTQTGVGYPQLSAIIECADAAHGVKGHIISDGGCKTPGDVVKAFGAGADFVMLGGMLAGHDESGGDIVERIEKVGYKYATEKYVIEDFEVKKYKQFYGMSSKKANDLYSNGLADYKSSEGRESLIPYKGPVANTLQNILGGLRSGCTYVGATKLKELTKRTTFVKVNNILNKVFERYSTD